MTTEVKLDERTQKFFEQRLAHIEAVQHALRGALALLVEQNGLEGQWDLDLPHQRLVRIDAQPQQVKAA